MLARTVVNVANGPQMFMRPERIVFGWRIRILIAAIGRNQIDR